MDVIIRESDEFIRLGQALKKAGFVSSGIEAKIVIQDKKIKVNNEIEERRGRKLYDGDMVSFGRETFRVKK